MIPPPDKLCDLHTPLLAHTLSTWSMAVGSGSLSASCSRAMSRSRPTRARYLPASCSPSHATSAWGAGREGERERGTGPVGSGLELTLHWDRGALCPHGLWARPPPLITLNRNICGPISSVLVSRM